MTWGLGSPRKLIPSDENPFLRIDKEKAYKRTLGLLNSITVSHVYAERKNKTQHQTKDNNHWTAIYIFDVALEKKGKSARLKSVCDYFKSVYPKESFWSGKSKTQLEELYDEIPKGKQYIFIGVEDGTAVLKDRTKTEKARSKSRRHICKKRTGHQAGVLIQYIGTHRWWEIDVLLKGDTTLVIFGSVTNEMNQFDNISENKWLSSNGLEFLHEKDKQIQKIETEKGRRKSKQLERDLGFWFGMALVRKSIDKGLSVFYLPEIDDSTLFDLELDEESEKEIISKPYAETRGDYQLLVVDEFINNEVILEALYNWKHIKEKLNLTTKHLKQRHIDAFIKYMQGIDAETIGDMKGVSASAITNKYSESGWLATVRTEILGHLIEYQLTQGGQYYENYKRIAGNARVDLLSPDKSKAIEVKTRWQKETVTEKMYSKEMIKLLDEGVSCELCSINIRYNKAFFKIYKITKIAKSLYEPSLPEDQARQTDRTEEIGVIKAWEQLEKTKRICFIISRKTGLIEAISRELIDRNNYDLKHIKFFIGETKNIDLNLENLEDSHHSNIIAELSRSIEL